MSEHQLFQPELETQTEYHEDPRQTPPATSDPNSVVTEGEEGAPKNDQFEENPDYQKWLEKDHETVVKAKVNSDQYIKQLQRENEGMRQELNTRMSLQEFLEKQEQDRQTTNANSGRRVERETSPSAYDDAEPEGEGMGKTKNTQDPGSQVNLTKEEINKVLEDTLKEREATQRKQTNLSYVKEKATAELGVEYPYLFSQKAKEMGLSQDYLNQMAMDQPQAFLALMLGQDYAKADSGAPPTSTQVSSEGRSTLSSTRKKGTHISDWNELRQTNPSDYWSTRVQNEIHQAAQQIGPSFYEPLK